MPRDAQLIASLADALPVGVWVGCVPGGELVYANAAFHEVMSVGRPQNFGGGESKSVQGIYTTGGERYPEDRMPFARAIEGRVTTEVDDMVVHRRDGSHVHVRALAKPLFDAAGEMTHVVVVFTDISQEVVAERARAERDARLRHAQRIDSSGKLRELAHDLNNLFASIKLLTFNLRRLELDETKLQNIRDIDHVTDSAAQLARYLTSLAGGATADGSPQRGSEAVQEPPRAFVGPKGSSERSGASKAPKRELSGPATILLVDDEDSMRNATAGVLAAQGYRVLTASDGLEALELFNRYRDEIALIILDVLMPRMGGAEALRRVRVVDPGVPILLSTGLELTGAMAVAARDAHAVLTKPYDLSTLLAAVRDALGQE